MSFILKTQNTDPIESLPVDENVVPSNELQIVNALFKEKQGVLTKIISGTKDILYVIALYLIFCLPQIDNLIHRFFPMSNGSIYIFYGIKAFLFGFIYFVILNIHSVYKK